MNFSSTRMYPDSPEVREGSGILIDLECLPGVVDDKGHGFPFAPLISGRSRIVSVLRMV